MKPDAVIVDLTSRQGRDLGWDCELPCYRLWTPCLGKVVTISHHGGDHAKVA